jgi:hypothetical protein
MRSFNRAQRAYDALTPEDVYGAEVELSAEDYAEAERQLGQDADKLVDWLTSSDWLSAYAIALFEKDSRFRAEVISHEGDTLDALALAAHEKASQCSDT